MPLVGRRDGSATPKCATSKNGTPKEAKEEEGTIIFNKRFKKEMVIQMNYRQLIISYL